MERAEGAVKVFWSLPLDQHVEMLLQLVKLSELLLSRVPLPVGCSNPYCLNLARESEVKVSKKTCTACKVVCYCSRDCQMTHWNAHKALCKKLRSRNDA